MEMKEMAVKTIEYASFEFEAYHELCLKKKINGKNTKGELKMMLKTA